MADIHDTGAPDLDHVVALMEGAKLTMVVCAACELEIFDKLHATKVGLSAEELASNHDWNKDGTERLLNALTSLNLLHKTTSEGKPTVYANRDGAKYLLRHDSPSIWGYSERVHRSIKNMSNLTREIKTGVNKGSSFPWQVTVHKKKPEDVQPGGSGEKQEAPTPDTTSRAYLITRYDTMDGLCRPHVDKLVKLVDLSQHHSAVDLGAGSGVVTFALRRAYPQMSVTLFEVPQVIELVKDRFLPKQEETITKKVTLMSGDFLENDLPPADLYVLSKIIHDWREDQTMVILEKVRAALNPGGAILLFEVCLDDDKCGPTSAHVGDLSIMSSCGGRLRSCQEYKDLLTKVNFHSVVIKLTQEWCPYDVIYARK